MDCFFVRMLKSCFSFGVVNAFMRFSMLNSFFVVGKTIFVRKRSEKVGEMIVVAWGYRLLVPVGLLFHFVDVNA